MQALLDDMVDYCPVPVLPGQPALSLKFLVIPLLESPPKGLVSGYVATSVRINFLAGKGVSEDKPFGSIGIPIVPIVQVTRAIIGQ